MENIQGRNTQPDLELAAKYWSEKFFALDGQIEKLQAFKDFVHNRLDEIGIPTHPDGEHSKAGCRIGDRLDIVARLRSALNELREAAKRFALARHNYGCALEVGSEDDIEPCKDEFIKAEQAFDAILKRGETEIDRLCKKEEGV